MNGITQLLSSRSNNPENLSYTIIGVFSKYHKIPSNFTPEIFVKGLEDINVYPITSTKYSSIFPLPMVNCNTLKDGVLSSSLKILFHNDDDLACFVYNTSRQVYHNYLRTSFDSQNYSSLNISQHKMQVMMLYNILLSFIFSDL